MICSSQMEQVQAMRAVQRLELEAGLLEGLVSQFGDLETALSDAQGERNCSSQMEQDLWLCEQFRDWS